jgi:Icc-related predicted phosphoesterase
MKILIIADDEGLLGSLPETEADVLISCGDLPDKLILECAKRCSCNRILAVKGNHDSSTNFSFGITDLHLETIRIENIRFGGFAGAWRYKPAGNHLFDQSEVSFFLPKFPAVDVFVTHNSPRGIHDRDDDVHLGFEAFVPYIDRVQPKLFLHGHQHVSIETQRGATRIIGTYGSRILVI